MTKKKVLLLFGSQDSEHSISVLTAKSIFMHFPFDEFDCYPVYITQTGQWLYGDFDLNQFETETFIGQEVMLRFDPTKPGLYCVETKENLEVDAAFLALHGPTGEGGILQGLLDMAHIPYTGSDVLASVTCMDKGITHQICEGLGIVMAPYQLIQSIDDINYDKITYPVIVKPSREGSSFGVSSAHNDEELISACELAFNYDSRILIEALIHGSEASIAILRTKEHTIVSKAVQTIVRSEYLSFEDKYVADDIVVHYDALYTEETKQRLNDLSVRIFEVMGARHLSRLDFFVTHDDNETIYFNEINTMPGFTSASLYPVLIANEGLKYTDLIRSLIRDIV